MRGGSRRISILKDIQWWTLAWESQGAETDSTQRGYPQRDPLLRKTGSGREHFKYLKDKPICWSNRTLGNEYIMHR